MADVSAKDDVQLDDPVAAVRGDLVGARVPEPFGQRARRPSTHRYVRDGVHVAREGWPE